ncbi:MAG: hypothetical protein WCY32_05260 [Burkholderiaceae bacterium]
MNTSGQPPAFGERRLGRFMMQVLWPSFLMAAVAVGLVFSMIDPQELVFVGIQLADNREAAYTVGFFLFWALFAASSALTWLLASSPERDRPG